MPLTPHILTGVAIITFVQNPILGLFLAFLGHYFLDCLPQIEYSIDNLKKRNWRTSLPDFLKVFSDISLGLSLVFLFSKNTPYIFAAAFLAILPDGFTFLNIILPKNKLLKRHSIFHKNIQILGESKKIPVWVKISSQIAVMAAAIYLLK